MDINVMRKAIEAAKTDRVTAIADKKNYVEQLAGKHDEIRKNGVEPEEAVQFVKELDEQITKDGPVLEAMIPEQYKVG